MEKYDLDFLEKEEAIFCGKLKDFYKNNEDFSDEITKTKSKGVYVILSSKKNFVYPNGNSRVIYIGKSNNAYKRLGSHRRNLEQIDFDKIEEYWADNKYLYMKKFGAKVYYISATGNWDAHNFESKVLSDFYDKYHAIPVGNGALSYGKR